MTCYLCGDGTYLEILRQDDVYVWTDAGDDDRLRRKYKCLLNQCKTCGHVYQPVDDELRRLFHEIYQSSHAQGPSAMGVGKWGMERADAHFFSAIDLTKHRTAVEIGCGDGYLLRRLKAVGFEQLTGIEPSVNVRPDLDGIRFINDFVDDQLRLDEQVDLIFSVAVFEHIEQINGVLAFCRNNLNAQGELFFVVPNAQRQLETGDPALFVHQHVHYFTEASIRCLLSRNSFQVKSIAARDDGFSVSASLGAAPAAVGLYDRYQEKLTRILDALRDRLGQGRVLVHGACNALNNIVCWIGSTFDLADNDENKQGKTYFNTMVRSPGDIDLSQAHS